MILTLTDKYGLRVNVFDTQQIISFQMLLNDVGNIDRHVPGSERKKSICSHIWEFYITLGIFGDAEFFSATTYTIAHTVYDYHEAMDLVQYLTDIMEDNTNERKPSAD